MERDQVSDLILRRSDEPAQVMEGTRCHRKLSSNGGSAVAFPTTSWFLLFQNWEIISFLEELRETSKKKGMRN